MTQMGVPNVLRNPALELRRSDGSVIATNNNWRETQPLAIQASGYASRERPRSSYRRDLESMRLHQQSMKSEDGLSGLGLFEVYDLDSSTGSKLANLSTRAVVTPGDNTLIAGVIVAGANTDQIVVRGLRAKPG